LVGGVAAVLVIFISLGNLRSTLLAAVGFPVAMGTNFIFLRAWEIMLNIRIARGIPRSPWAL